jgi:rod shape-determining protein MreD
MKSWLVLLTFAGVVLLLRSTALTALAARGVVVDVLAFATVVWALRYGAAWGASFGWALGLAADIDAVHWLGRHALVLALIGYAVGRLSRTLVRDSGRTQLVLVLLAAALHQAWTVAFEIGGVEGWPYLAQRVLLAALVTPPLGVLLLSIMRHGSGQPLFGHAAVESRPAH